MEQRLQPGIYVIKYRIGGVFEILSVSRGDILQAYNKTIKSFSNIKPVKDRVIFDQSTMTAKVYIQITSPLSLDRWNTRFLNNLRSVYNILQRYGQWLSFKYVSHEKAQPEEAEHKGLVESFTSQVASPFGNWALWAIPVAIGAYAVSKGLVGRIGGQR